MVVPNLVFGFGSQRLRPTPTIDTHLPKKGWNWHLERVPPPKKPKGENKRLASLRALQILDSPPDSRFDRLTRLASELLGVPIALVSLVDENRQWFKSKVGLEAQETPRDHAFCAHAILGEDPLVVADATEDPRFQDNPMVQGDPKIRFYAGVPLLSEHSHGLGTLCVIDHKPKELSNRELQILKDLAAIATDELELHRIANESKKRQVELERSNQDLELFAYVASHDLKEPLRMISSFMDLLSKSYGPQLDDDAREYIRFATDGANRMNAQLEGLLEMSKLGRIESKPTPIDLNGLVEESIHMLRPKSENAKIEIGPLPTILGDRDQLLRAFQNILSNSLKFCRDEPPEIEVSASRDSDGWEISIRDHGVGFKDEHSARVFEMFHRLHHRDEFEGTGMGLAIVQRIIKLHGGSIRAESQEGEGATFFLRFPSEQSAQE